VGRKKSKFAGKSQKYVMILEGKRPNLGTLLTTTNLAVLAEKQKQRFATVRSWRNNLCDLFIDTKFRQMAGILFFALCFDGILRNFPQFHFFGKIDGNLTIQLLTVKKLCPKFDPCLAEK
jgi:hypothetical protein